MDIKKLQTFENLVPQAGNKINSVVGNGPSFKDTLSSIGSPTSIGGSPSSIQKELKSVVGNQGVKFSNHAIERMQSRGINFNQDDISRLNEAVGRAAAKGAKDSLILMNDSALIVSVKNNTVVTVMDKTALKENVFTNIDSTIVM